MGGDGGATTDLRSGERIGWWWGRLDRETYVGPSSYKSPLVTLPLPVCVAHNLRGHAFLVNTFLMSDMALVCAIDRTVLRAGICRGAEMEAVKTHSRRIAIRCMELLSTCGNRVSRHVMGAYQRPPRIGTPTFCMQGRVGQGWRGRCRHFSRRKSRHAMNMFDFSSTLR